MSLLPVEKHDIVIIGTGFAGLCAAWQAHLAGRRVCVVAKNFGGTRHFSGAFDVVDFDHKNPSESVPVSRNVLQALMEFARAHPIHPYHGWCTDESRVSGLLSGLAGFLKFYGIQFYGDGEHSIGVFAADGRCRSTVLALGTSGFPLSLLKETREAVWIHVPGLVEYPLELICENLFKIFSRVRVLTYDGLLPNFSSPLASIASACDDPARFGEFKKFVMGRVSAGELVLMPPLLGLDRFLSNQSQLEEATGCRLVELLSTLPSVSGLRVTRQFEKKMTELRWSFLKAEALRPVIEDHVVQGVVIRGGDLNRNSGVHGELMLTAKDFVLASGKFIGGGIVHAGHFFEPLFGLPLRLDDGCLSSHANINQTISRRLTEDQDFMRVGVAREDVFVKNLKLCGHIMQGFDFTREKCGFGVSVMGSLV